MATMAERFFRNQNAHERVQRLNDLGEAVDNIDARLTAIEQTGTPLPSTSPLPDFGLGTEDPGDLSVYYENGKA